MPIDVGTPVVEVAIGLAFVFFLLSLIVSAGTEAIAWAFKWRARTLVKGIDRLFGNEEIVEAILRHPLVQSDVTTPAKKRKPSYVSSRNFALALIQILRKPYREDSGGKQAQLKAGVNAYCEETPVGAQLQALLDEAGDSVEKFRAGVERWFDDAMDRVSGWYKRWSQAIAILLAVVVTVGLNVDAVRVTERLANDQALRASVVAHAQTKVEKREQELKAQQEQGESQAKAPSLKETGAKAEGALADLKALQLPMLWSEANDNVTLNTLFGWLLTAIAISLGAPFWFDTLSKLARLKTTGKAPEPEKK